MANAKNKQTNNPINYSGVQYGITASEGRPLPETWNCFLHTATKDGHGSMLCKSHFGSYGRKPSFTESLIPCGSSIYSLPIFASLRGYFCKLTRF